MPKVNWLLSTLLVTTMISGWSTGLTQTTRAETKLSESGKNLFQALPKQDDPPPPVPERQGGSNKPPTPPVPERNGGGSNEEPTPPASERNGGSRGELLCPIAPRGIDTIPQVWSDRPLFVWRGAAKQIEVRLQGSQEVLWRQEVTPADRSLMYGGEALQPGQTYIWVIFDLNNKAIAQTPFQIMEAQQRDRIKTRLQILQEELREKGASAEEIAMRRAQYFAQQQLWSDVWREVNSVENPSPALLKILQTIPTPSCTRPSRQNSAPSP